MGTHIYLQGLGGHQGPVMLARGLRGRATNISGWVSRADGLRGVFYSAREKEKRLWASFRETIPSESRLGEGVKSEWAEEVQGSKSIPKLPACCLQRHRGCVGPSWEAQRKLRQDIRWSEPGCSRRELPRSQQAGTLTHFPV